MYSGYPHNLAAIDLLVKGEARMGYVVNEDGVALVHDESCGSTTPSANSRTRETLARILDFETKLTKPLRRPRLQAARM